MRSVVPTPTAQSHCQSVHASYRDGDGVLDVAGGEDISESQYHECSFIIRWRRRVTQLIGVLAVWGRSRTTTWTTEVSQSLNVFQCFTSATLWVLSCLHLIEVAHVLFIRLAILNFIARLTNERKKFFKVIQGHPYWCWQKSITGCRRNVDLISVG